MVCVLIVAVPSPDSREALTAENLVGGLGTLLKLRAAEASREAAPTCVYRGGLNHVFPALKLGVDSDEAVECISLHEGTLQVSGHPPPA